jgi:hypothetical protein
MTPWAYRFELSLSGAAVDAKLNDFPVFRTIGALPAEVSMPVTPWLVSGRNDLALDVGLGPAPPQAVELVLGFARHRPNFLKETQVELTRIAYDGGRENPTEGAPLPGPSAVPDAGAAGPVTVTPARRGFVVRRGFDLRDSIPRWRWVDSATISDTPETRASLMTEYQRIWELLNARELGGFPALLEERTAEYRQALHADAEAIPADYGLGTAVSDPASRLHGLEPEDAEFHLYGGGRLAEFTRWDGKPLIVFEEEDIARYFRFIFRREGERWIVSR